MTHTKTCENATNKDCYYSCGGLNHGRNPKFGTVEMKEGFRERTYEEKLEKSWNNASYSTRLFTLGPVTGTIKDRDEAEFASRSSWNELSPTTRQNLVKHSELSQRGLKGTKGK